VLATLAFHVRTQVPGARAAEVVILAASALLGFLVDTAFLRWGVITLEGAAVSPPWLVALWPNLAATTATGSSLAVLAKRPGLAACAGGLGGAAAYDAGSRLGALTLGESQWRSLGLIGVAWTSVLPIFFLLRRSAILVPGEGE
jgi:hypothetical protein